MLSQVFQCVCVYMHALVCVFVSVDRGSVESDEFALQVLLSWCQSAIPCALKQKADSSLCLFLLSLNVLICPSQVTSISHKILFSMCVCVGMQCAEFTSRSN